jgi:glutamyl-tRNA synthetase
MRNFLALLGWSPGEDREIMSEEEMVSLFSLEAIQKKPAVFDPVKLEWMNGQYLSRIPTTELVPLVVRELERMQVHFGGPHLLPPYIEAVKSRSHTILEMAERVAVRLDSRHVKLDDKGRKLRAKMGDAYVDSLKIALETLGAVDERDWNAGVILERLRARAEAGGMKLGDLMQPIRVALTGSTVSEPVNELLAVVGRASALARLTRAAERSW